MPDLQSVLAEFVDLIRILRPLAERALNTPHFWEPEGAANGDRNSLEAQAIVLLTTLEKPTVSEIARRLNIPRGTLRGFRNFREARDRIAGPVRTARRGRLDDIGANRPDEN